MFPNGEYTGRRSDIKDFEYGIKFNTTLINRLTNEPITDTRVRVRVFNRDTGQESIIEHRKDESGNIVGPLRANWKGKISGVFTTSFEQYVYSHWMTNDFSVEVLDGPLAGQTIGRKVYLNPWEKDRYLFSIDDDADSVNEIRSNPEPVNARIHVDGVMYILIGNNVHNFRVNDYLGLTINKTYQVVMNPRIDYGHRFTKNSYRDEKMRDGKFTLKFTIWAPKDGEMLITEENFKDKHGNLNFEYITGAEKVVAVKNGIVNELVDLPIKVTDLPKLSMRTVAVVELAPINDIKLRKSVVTGFFKAKIPWIKTNVMQNPSLNYDVKKHEEKIENYEKSLTDANTLKSNLDRKAKKATYQDEVPNAETVKKSLEDTMGEEKAHARSSEFEVSEILSGSLEDIKNKKEEYEDSQRKLSFRKFIEDSFNKIQENNAWKSENTRLKESAKEIFVKNLKHENEETVVISRKKAKEQYGLNITDKDLKPFFTKKGTRTFIKKDDGSYFAVYSKEFINKLCTAAFTTLNKNGITTEGWHLGGDTVSRTRTYGGTVDTKRTVDTKWVRACATQPTRYFNINAYRHVKEIKKIKTGPSNGLSIHVGSRYNTNKSYSENVYYNLRWGLDMGLKLPMGDMLGGGLKIFDFSQGYSWNYAEGDALSDQVAVDKSLAVEKYSVDVTAAYEKCIHIQGKTVKNTIPHGYTYATITVDVPLQLYVCDEAKEEKITEAWYYIQENFYGSPILRDPFGPTEIKLTKVLRGEKSYLAFKERMETQIKSYLATDSISIESAENILYNSWAHIVPGSENMTEKEVAEVIQETTEGSFPGTSF